MPRIVTFKANPLTLGGRALKINTIAPDFNVISQDLKGIGLSDFKAKVKIISSFPSLDTPVCDLQVKEFNKRASGLSLDVVVIGISKDLPFAQKRFCQENNISNEVILSDYRFGSFGINYGLLINELNLLARAVCIVDINNILRYIQISPEITIPLDYNDAIKNLEDVLRNPVVSAKDETPSKCRPCEGGIAVLPKDSVDRLIAQSNGWQLIEDKKISKEFKFKDWADGKYFLDLVSVISEEQGHHPTATLTYGKLKITLTTHNAGGLTDNDFIMAKIIDQMAE